LFIIVFSFARWMEGHKLGYYIKAVRDRQEAAESLGVNSPTVKLTALCGPFSGSTT